MKKLSLLSIIIIFALSSVLYAQNFKGVIPRPSIMPPGKTLTLGEILEYSVEWLGIPVGRIILKVEDKRDINNRQCYHIVARAVPNKFLAKIFDVEYTVHTYIDKKTLSTQRFEKTRRIKDKLSYVVIDFNHQKREVKFKTEGFASGVQISKVRQQMETSIPATLKILNGTQDLLSSIYFLRLMEVKENQNYSISIYYDQRIWNLNMKVNRIFFKDIRNIGTFAVLEVYMNSDLITFILGRPNIFVNITTDSRRIPLEFKFVTGLGPVRGIIQNLPK